MSKAEYKFGVVRVLADWIVDSALTDAPVPMELHLFDEMMPINIWAGGA